ncbi:MAG TPA: hypothetical protein PLE30_05720 [Candidatus Kapabacteria bacterium]|nr:hypothetical protein [Candidatus Kapabacteria bacterium]
MRVATIDIGTNTILMLIVEVNNKDYKIISQHFSTPRLGEGVDKTNVISENSCKRAFEVLETYKQIIEDLSIVKVIANATSALRDASNKIDIKSRLEIALGSPISIISGEEEAYFSFIGAVDTTSKTALIDVGGGSTEIMIGKNNKIIERYSYQLGVVRLTERIFNYIAPISKSKIDEAIAYTSDILSKHKINLSGLPLFAVSGTPCALATSIKGLPDSDADKINGSKLYKSEIYDLLIKFSKLKPDEISTKYRINPKRADLITAGALILYVILDINNIDYLIVSSKGLRFGILQNYLNSIN